ncbi:L-threonine 3-dehydrogenase [Streptomyces sp. enrichment culture]
MEAAVVRAFGEPLVIEERPDPEPGAGQVRIRVEASGLCHTDIHAAHGDWPIKPDPPFVPGHEGVGPVEKLGEGVTHLSVGQRVTVPWLGKACGGASTACRAGRRCASSRSTPATAAMAVMPRRGWHGPTSLSRCQTGTALSTPPH